MTDSVQMQRMAWTAAQADLPHGVVWAAWQEGAARPAQAGLRQAPLLAQLPASPAARSAFILSFLSNLFLFTTWQAVDIVTQLTCLCSLGSFGFNFYSSKSSSSSSSSISSCDAHAEQLSSVFKE